MTALTPAPRHPRHTSVLAAARAILTQAAQCVPEDGAWLHRRDPVRSPATAPCAPDRPRGRGPRMAGSAPLFWAAACIGAAALVPPAWAGDSGTAKFVRGDVRIERDGKSVPLRVGDPVLEKDRIVVPAEGSAGITLGDDTRISVGPRSTLVINGFTFDQQTQEGSVDTSIVRGTMRYVTGLIGRLNPKSVRVATPTATVGIRGTDFIIEVADAD